jgi:serine/threonine-protein kinase
MLTPSGAKVVDFGISALIGENDIDPDGSLLGTPAYLAPERLEGGQVSPATDVYAVGLLIYRTLIGQLPWDVGTTTALLRAHQYTEPEPLPPVEGLPVAVATLIGRCLEKRPDDRPSSAELAHVLAGVSAGSPASRGFVPDWGDSSEDTTILPSAHPYTDGHGIGRVRPGQARVPEQQAGRGVAAVRAAADGPAGLAAAAAAMAAAAESSADAPVSPAPGNAMPVSVLDVEAAVAGERVEDNAPVAASVSPAAPRASGAAASGAVTSGAVASGAVASGAVASGAVASGAVASGAVASGAVASGAAAPALAPPGGGNRGPDQGPGRNNRFVVTPKSSLAAGASASASGAPASPVASLRPAFGGSGKFGESVPAQRSGGGTPPPPPGDRPGGSGPGGGKGPRKNRGRNMRMLLLVGLVVLLGGGAYAYSLAAGAGKDDSGVQAQTLPPAIAAANPGKCVVSYAVWSDTGDRYKASVTVANRQNAAVKNWELWFINPGDQVLSGKTTGFKLAQQKHEVTVSAPSALSPQKAVTMEITGRYSESNAAPMRFELNKQACETYVSGKPGEPSRPVQVLADGQRRLGPPAAQNPVPGISIGPGGVVTPVPLPPTTNGPTTAGPTGTTAGTTTSPTTATTTTVAPEPDPVETTTTTTVPTTDPTTTDPVLPTQPTEDPDPADSDFGSAPNPLPQGP